MTASTSEGLDATERAELERALAAFVDALSARSADLARVLVRCSYLSDAVAVRNLDTAMLSGQIVDVLPPFAGG